MINNMTLGKACAVFCFLILILSACATEPRREIVKIEPTVKAEPLLPIDVIDKKISTIQNLLENNKIQEKDREFFSNLLSDYQKVRYFSQTDHPQGDYKESILILFRNLTLLDEKYLSYKEQVNDEIRVKALNDLYLKKQNIFKKYISRDYKGVIEESNELEKTFGKDSFSYEINVLLAMSLSKEGKLSDAIKIGDSVVKEIEGKPDLIQLRSLLIDWRIKTGRKERALKEYQNLFDDLNVRQAILNKTASRLNIESKIVEDDTTEKENQEKVNHNAKENLEAALKLIEEEEYEPAINMLDQIKRGGDSNPDIDKQMVIAVDKLINKERNRAAKIFLTAKKTDDIKKKEELLRSAQNILNGLIDKYPSSGMIEKIKSNLVSVNVELKKIAAK
jgi:hypothetical protein